MLVTDRGGTADLRRVTSTGDINIHAQSQTATAIVAVRSTGGWGAEAWTLGG